MASEPMASEPMGELLHLHQPNTLESDGDRLQTMAHAVLRLPAPARAQAVSDLEAVASRFVTERTADFSRTRSSTSQSGD